MTRSSPPISSSTVSRKASPTPLRTQVTLFRQISSSLIRRLRGLQSSRPSVDQQLKLDQDTPILQILTLNQQSRILRRETSQRKSSEVKSWNSCREDYCVLHSMSFIGYFQSLMLGSYIVLVVALYTLHVITALSFLCYEILRLYIPYTVHSTASTMT